MIYYNQSPPWGQFNRFINDRCLEEIAEYVQAEVKEHILSWDLKRMEAFNNNLVIRYLDRVVVKDDGYAVTFKAGVTVEVEI